MKKVLITGASDGIGKEIAKLLDKDGYELYLFGRTKEKFDSFKLKHLVKTYVFDLKDQNTLIESIDDIKSQGGIDILINNAGFNPKKDEVIDIDINDIEDMFAVNTIAPLILIKAFVPGMIKNKNGLVVNVLSSCCRFYNQNSAGYTASKKAFEAISKTLVKEVKDKGVKVLDIYPGGVDTNFRKIAKPEYLKPETIAKQIAWAIENNDDGMIQEIVCRPIIENNY